MHSVSRFQFLQFTYDVSTGELTTAGETVRLQPQPAAALKVLLQNAGQLVTRETLKQAIWPDTVVEADQGLNFCVRQIRIALGEDSEGGRIIETLPRRGYRFVAPVSPVVASTSAPAEPTSAVGDATNAGVHSRTTSVPAAAGVAFNQRSLGVAALVALAALLMVVAFADGNRKPKPPTLAILPLASPDSDAWVRSENGALTEALVSALTNAPRDTFGVIGPSSTAQFSGSTAPHTEIGSKLDADFVVSGGLRTTDTTMFVQVIRVSDGKHVFAW